VVCLLVAAIVGMSCYRAKHRPWVGGGIGVVTFVMLRAWYGYISAARMWATWQRRQLDLQQQVGLVRQLGVRELCPWWGRVLAWCVLLPLFLVSWVLAMTLGQLFILWKQPRENWFWLRACVSFEPLFWLCVVWGVVRMAVGVDTSTGVNRVLAAATAMRGTL